MSHKFNRGFSVIELLVVIFILGLLVSMTFSGLQSVRESARRLVCQNNMKQLSLALHQFETSHQLLPPTLSLERNEVMRHWQAAVIPFLEQKNVYDEMMIDFGNRIHPWYQRHSLTTIPTLQCPTNPDQGFVFPSMLGGIQFAFTDYCGVAGVNLTNEDLGIFPIGADRLRLVGISFGEVIDGLSNTLAFGERPPVRTGAGYGRWLGSQTSLSASIGVEERIADFQAIPEEDCNGCSSDDTGFHMGVRGSTCDWLHHWSYHSGGANFAKADGSVDFIPYSISADTLKGLATRAGGETVSLEF